MIHAWQWGEYNSLLVVFQIGGTVYPALLRNTEQAAFFEWVLERLTAGLFRGILSITTLTEESYDLIEERIRVQGHGFVIVEGEEV